MGREIWGTYSVKDHLENTAFMADLILYDRLVPPVPEAELDTFCGYRRWRKKILTGFGVIESALLSGPVSCGIGRWPVWCARDQVQICKSSFEARGGQLVFLIQIRRSFAHAGRRLLTLLVPEPSSAQLFHQQAGSNGSGSL